MHISLLIVGPKCLLNGWPLLQILHFGVEFLVVALDRSDFASHCVIEIVEFLSQQQNRLL